METLEIKLRIHDENELYSRFDEDRQVLSDDVISYISDRFDERKLGSRIRVKIISDEPLDEENVKSAFMRSADALKSLNKKQRLLNNGKMIRLLIIGVALLAIGIVLTISLDQLPLALISAVGTFAVWEAASICLVKNPENTAARQRIEKLRDAEMEFEVKRQ
ncbi:MAG: hypothetical protein IIZ19_02290 [Clostridia bacterium]|nr:hypothetical protein [Clostridia bacterium]MBQ1434712.1 hypothetical protein [Clostridia bacterium]